ncbi:unnamed protein product [Strongylus vulgaris]|uniref:Uncharacterized protein n=1 Tax=Strongylus vulgaris TaxID=40348 RepID=A0A3P7IMU2_STRVU|nr:unnamed protein product [Strongylus vulgaris]
MQSTDFLNAPNEWPAMLARSISKQSLKSNHDEVAAVNNAQEDEVFAAAPKTEHGLEQQEVPLVQLNKRTRTGSNSVRFFCAVISPSKYLVN